MLNVEKALTKFPFAENDLSLGINPFNRKQHRAQCICQVIHIVLSYIPIISSVQALYSLQFLAGRFKALSNVTYHHSSQIESGQKHRKEEQFYRCIQVIRPIFALLCLGVIFLPVDILATVVRSIGSQCTPDQKAKKVMFLYPSINYSRTAIEVAVNQFS